MFNSRTVSTSLTGTLFLLGLFLSGCSSASELAIKDPAGEPSNTDYSVIYYIHADSDYLYHDTTGSPVRGNSRVLNTAFSVGEESKSGEVFIFYQRSEKKFLGLFPRKQSRFYHYTGGKLTSRVKYRHSDKNEDFLTTEARLYDQYRTHSGQDSQRTYFLYFGHEIPDDNGENYHRTNPNISVNISSFSAGVQKFLDADDRRLDLMVLSTCNNGTPAMVEQLLPYSDLLLASPQNLHLSHINSERLDLLESDPGVSSKQIADSMAAQTYQRLEEEIQTAITLSLYDMGKLRQYKEKLRAFSTAYNAKGSLRHYSDNVDCKQAQFFDEEIFERGVKVWYKPSGFGREASKNTHSGWGCKPLAEDGRTSSEHR